MNSQELFAVLDVVQVLLNYDILLHDNLSERMYEDLTDKVQLAQGLDAALSVISLAQVGLSWADFYSKVDSKACFAKHGQFIPDKIYDLIVNDNIEIDYNIITNLFKQAQPLIKKGKTNDKTRKTRTKRTK